MRTHCAFFITAKHMNAVAVWNNNDGGDNNNNDERRLWIRESMRMLNFSGSVLYLYRGVAILFYTVSVCN